MGPRNPELPGVYRPLTWRRRSTRLEIISLPLRRRVAAKPPGTTATSYNYMYKCLHFGILALVLSWQTQAWGEPAKGPLTVCKTNPRYFADGSGRAVYLTGSSCGWEMQDDAWSGYSAPGTHVKFDFEKFLN